VCSVKTSRDVQMTCASVTHLDVVLSLETLLILKVEKSLICLMGTPRATISLIERRLILFLETLTRSKESSLLSFGIKSFENEIIQNRITLARETELIKFIVKYISELSSYIFQLIIKFKSYLFTCQLDVPKGHFQSKHE
jgi:hypothetical protein